MRVFQLSRNGPGILGDPGVVNPARPWQVDGNFSLDAAGAAREDDDTICQTGCFPRIVSNGEDGFAGSHEDVLQFRVELGADERIQGGEGLID